ncbi:hypothetical protein PVAND_015521 [Polypedilum vanderplanki]|uniref:BTB domain-containing protein n=1 Tax=Polypedilum vanderplanki TaxID=319348 RepID=A0A9J6BDB8_POLVA|nr:hypothetical protein PVAND_015521 [Polypedilum vanderplanki]
MNSAHCYYCGIEVELPEQYQQYYNENNQLTEELKTVKKELQQLKDENPIFNDIKKILSDPDFKDFTINVGQSSFKVHKTLFAARSATLAEIFKNNPDAQELNLKDIPESIFKAVHDFVYNNQLPEDENSFIEIFAAAARLKIEDLIKRTSAEILTKIDVKNAFEILVLSNKFDHEQMRQKSFKIIQRKIFPNRKLDAELAKQPEKLKKLIEMKTKLDKEQKELNEKFQNLWKEIEDDKKE